MSRLTGPDARAAGKSERVRATRTAADGVHVLGPLETVGPRVEEALVVLIGRGCGGGHAWMEFRRGAQGAVSASGAWSGGPSRVGGAHTRPHRPDKLASKGPAL